MRFSHLYLYVLENFGIWGLGLLENTMYLNSTNNAKCNNNPRLRIITIHVYNLYNKTSDTNTRYQIEKRNVFVLSCDIFLIFTMRTNLPKTLDQLIFSKFY